ncbi:MAG: carboxypeptidase-like regulatory domain-containing protein, partial [Bacteroidetes bacterium]|nr:carboxypeptidase-like regulatory domain-containing protein [Bacteroidota bacterium]
MRLHFFLNTILLVLCTLLFSVHIAAAQSSTGVIRGFVYDQSSGEPILFTNVYLQGTTLGSSTDAKGFFTITRIPAGNYKLMSSYLGYDTASVQIRIKGGDILNEKLFLRKSSLNLGMVEVSGEKEEQRTTVKVSVETVTPKQITQIVSVGGEADIAQYLQVLPGVVFTGDQGGQLYIR